MAPIFSSSRRSEWLWDLPCTAQGSRHATGRQASNGAQRNGLQDAQQSDNKHSTTQYLDNNTKWMQLKLYSRKGANDGASKGVVHRMSLHYF